MAGRLAYSVSVLLLGLGLMAALPVAAEEDSPAPEVREGMSPAQVESVLGQPNGRRALQGGQIWVYSGGVSLRFDGGRLVAARGVPFGDGETADPGVRFTEEASAPDPPSGTSAEAVAPADDGADKQAMETAEQPAESHEEENPAKPDDWESVEQLDQVEQAAKDAAAGQLPEGADLPAPVTDRETQAGAVPEWLRPAVLVLLQFVFLLLACRLTGTEAHWAGLVVIALLDRLATLWVQWLFLSVLGFPSVLHADTLVSFLVMLLTVMKFTSAKSLPSALKVVVTAKVAAILTGYAVFLFLLSQLAP